MGRRGPEPDHAKREAFARLISEGVPSLRASRMVGIDPRTGKRWRNGRRIVSGGRVVDLPPAIAPVSLSVKRRSPRHLSEDERVRLADLRRERRTMRDIARLMGRSPPAISRELARGAGAAGRHRPSGAHRRALGRRRLRRPSRPSLDVGPRDRAAARPRARRGPEQDPRRLRREWPDMPERWLCAETIHRAVHRPDLGGPPRELPGRVLRQRRRHRVPRRHAEARRSAPVTGMTPIHERPAEAIDRVEPGHRVRDPIMGAADRTAIVTLAGRTTRRALLGHLPDGRHDPATVRDAVIAAMGGLPAHLRRTLTWDQGKGMALHPEIAMALGMRAVFFCHPRSPWQRPTNENTNGILRDYLPKGTDLSVHTAEDIALVQAELNRRPRKVLGWDTPADRMAMLLGSESVLRR